MTPRLSLVAAVARNNVIGSGGKLPWHLPSDLAFFKKLTLGKPIVMGRKTFASIGRPLPGRTNIVVTRAGNFTAPGIEIAPSLDSALEMARRAASASGADEIFVIGGGELYRAALPRADRLYITHVDAAPEGETTFPAIDPAIWTATPVPDIVPGDKDTHRFAIRVYDRRQSRAASH